MDFAPTPIQFLWEDEQGNRVYVKREDLLPYSFGGNKARIGLEYLADMERQGKDHLIAYGNARSNLCRVLSNLCCARNIPCTILSPADDDGQRRPSFNQRFCEGFGAQIVPCLKTGVGEAVERALAESRRQGRKPYYIYGDSTGQGNLATPVRAYRKVWPEILRQQQELGCSFDRLFLAAGTGMTQAGLLCGRLLDGGDTEIHGISIARSEENGKAHLRRYVEAFLGEEYHGPELQFTDRYALQYGVSTPEMAECARQVFRRYGMPMDLTYVGKGYYGMVQEIRRLGLRNERILFLHTGGTPLFFDSQMETTR